MSYQYNRLTLIGPTARNKHHRPIRLQSERGVVVIIALFVVALVATISYVMMARLDRDTLRTRLILRNTQAEYYAQGSIDWAMDTLRNNLKQQKPQQLVDHTPIQSPVNEVNGYSISSIIYDVQARFNLNNISTPGGQADFKRLLKAVAPTLGDDEANDIAAAIFDWISPASPTDKYNQYYQEQALPYRAAHRPMFSRTELRLVKGMTPDLYQAVQDYVIALPNHTEINIQSASPQVLASLSPSMSLDSAKSLEKIRLQKPFVSNQAFLGLDILKNHRIPPEKITTVSRYFLVETKVSIENQRVLLYTLLERLPQNSKKVANILWQSKGVW